MLGFHPRSIETESLDLGFVKICSGDADGQPRLRTTVLNPISRAICPMFYTSIGRHFSMNLVKFYTTTLFQVIFSRMLKQQIALSGAKAIFVYCPI